ncbi:MAG: NAD(P)/FAD-dependent oxidoreductase [Desulfobacterota bacterium]|jgi:prolycopene isomerase|nr:NAD(P)/FAD-dependent oxidoreductase [Thermodesulfobacteriota bacterium]
MPVYDAVVIGAGNGGMTAALTLAQAGKKVLLLERHNIPGGCATSFVRGRFEFEVALHQLSGMGSQERPGPLRAILGEMGVMDRLEFVEIENLYRVVFPGTFDITLPTNREGLVAELAKLFPGEGDAVSRFMDLVYRFSMEMVQGLFFHDPDISKEKYPVYFKYAFRNSQEVLDEFFESPLLKSILSVYWGYVGVPPSMLPFGDLAIMLWAYIEFKPYHLKGGSQAMSNAILDAYLAAGGEVRFNCAAKKIVVGGGAVKGVITEQGDRVETGCVVSNASTIHTYIDLIDREEVPAAELNAFKSHTIGPSAFTLYMGLDCEPADVGIHETTNFITTTVDADRAFDLWKTMEQQGWALLTCYDVSDPDFSPPGTCQAALVALQYGDPWYAVSPQEYADAKYRYAEGMLQLAERVFPKIRDHIEEVEAATPLTHLRYLGHPGGAIYGFEQYAKDSPYFLTNRSSIRGLYFAGAWVGSGGFQPTLTSGRSTARAVLKALKNQ